MVVVASSVARLVGCLLLTALQSLKKEIELRALNSQFKALNKE